MNRRFVAGLAAAALATAPGTSAAASLADVLGTWHGSSTCVGGAGSACKDEQVTLRWTRAEGTGHPLLLTAEKFVGTSSDTMAVLDMDFDAATGTWVSEFTIGRTHGLMRFAPRGARLEGTLHVLPESTLVRLIDVARDSTGRAFRPEALDRTRAALAPLTFLEGTWRGTGTRADGGAFDVERVVRFGNDRLVLHFDAFDHPTGVRTRLDEGFITLDRTSGRLAQWIVKPDGERVRSDVTRADSTGFEVREAKTWSVVRRVGPDEVQWELRVPDGSAWRPTLQAAFHRSNP
jgi:hypothetical protein